MTTLKRIAQIRDELYESLPTGNVDAWELLTAVKSHIAELDILMTDMNTEVSLPSPLKEEEIEGLWRRNSGDHMTKQGFTAALKGFYSRINQPSGKEMFVALINKMTESDWREADNGFAGRVYDRISNQPSEG